MAPTFPPALPDTPRLPGGSTEGGKMPAGFSPSRGAAPHLRGGYPRTQPAETPLNSRRIVHSPCGHLPSSGKAPGRSPRRRRSRSGEGAIAAASPVAPLRCEKKAPRRAGPPHLCRAGGSGESSGLEMIRKYPVTWGALK